MLDDYSRYMIAWKLCSPMRAEDVTEMLDMALEASSCERANVLHEPAPAQRQRPQLHRG